MKRIFKILLFLLINLMAVEAALHLQQGLGPFLDLESYQTGYDRLSDELNHVSRPVETRTLVSKERYGDHAGFRYEQRRDELGIRINALRSARDPEAPQVLFLGDSFVEGYDDAHTLVQIVAETLDPGGRIRWLNAGHSSYSPAIFIPQARRLLAERTPDAVVVVIDQSDLGDDVLRYEHLIRRDAEGRIASVAPSPPLVAYYAGLEAALSHRFYLQRAVAKLHHLWVRMPRIRRDYRAQRPGGTLQFCREPIGGEAALAAAERIFRRNIDELLDLLINAVGDPRQVLLVSHPHLQHLVADENGRLWHDRVGPILAQAARAKGAHCWSAERDLAAAFGDDPARYYWPVDLHFNFAGQRIYGELLARQVAPLVIGPTDILD